MTTRVLSRRSALLLPLAFAACGTESPSQEPQNFRPFDFSYLLPLRLNVGSIDIEQRFVPSGVPPDVTQYDPVPPAAALRAMAEQRLKAEGSSGRAVFIINDASLVRRGDAITGTMAVELQIVSGGGPPVAFAQASVVRQLDGASPDLPSALYQFTSQMMDQMNVEFEYQVRHALGGRLLPESAEPSPVQATPLPSGPGGQSVTPQGLPQGTPGPANGLPPPQPGLEPPQPPADTLTAPPLPAPMPPVE